MSIVIVVPTTCDMLWMTICHVVEWKKKQNNRTYQHNNKCINVCDVTKYDRTLTIYSSNHIHSYHTEYHSIRHGFWSSHMHLIGIHVTYAHINLMRPFENSYTDFSLVRFFPGFFLQLPSTFAAIFTISPYLGIFAFHIQNS